MSWLYTVVFAGLLFSSQESSEPTPEVTIQNDPVVTESLLSDETEKFDQTYPLTANGKFSISNINGSITLEAWDRSEVRVEYVKTADTRERLAEVDVRIDSKPDSLRIETDYGDWRKNNGDGWHTGRKLQVDFHVMVPRGASLSEVETVNGSVTLSNFVNFSKVAAVNGTVTASNLRGTANLSTVNGEIAADFDQLEAGGKVILNTVNGHVKLVIPSDSNATVKVDTLNGAITNDFGLPVRKGKYVGRDLYGRIGSGETQIRLTSVNGGLSIGRRNDGKNPNPSTNLLPQKKDDDDYWDKDDGDESSRISTKTNREIAKAAKDAEKQIKMIQPEIAKITVESVARAADADKLAAEVVKSEEVQKSIKDIQIQQADMARAVEAVFVTPVPRVVKKSGSIPVNGVPKVTIDGKGCSVSIRGWDKSEVRYSLTQVSSTSDHSPLKISEDHTDSAVNISVDDPAASKAYLDNELKRVHIEIFVPRKSNLKIKANGEIRLEGVSGDVSLTGGEDSINVRDVDGILQVANSDGRIRVIGFRGEINAESSGGSISLEGDFQKLKAHANIGSIMLTLPDDAQADIETTSSAIQGEGITLTRTGGDEKLAKYRIGKGGARFQIETDGEVKIRGAGTLRSSL